MRQRADFRRHAPVGENAGNARLVGLGPDQAFVEAVGLTQLKTNALDGLAEPRRRGFVAELIQNAPLVGREVFGIARRKAPQQRGIARLGLLDDVLALPRRIGGIEAQHLVNQSQVPVVVQQPLLGRDLGVDADPEAHIGLELRRIGESIGGRGARRRAAEERRQQRQAKPMSTFRPGCKQIEEP